MLETGQTEPGLVDFYDIQPGNRVGLFLQARSPHGDSCIHSPACMLIIMPV